jgi:hypothetical protein
LDLGEAVIEKEARGKCMMSMVSTAVSKYLNFIICCLKTVTGIIQVKFVSAMFFASYEGLIPRCHVVTAGR